MMRGGVSLLRRNTGSVPNGPEFRRKSYRYAKGTALALAALAVAISAFDLSHIAVLKTTAEFISKYRTLSPPAVVETAHNDIVAARPAATKLANISARTLPRLDANPAAAEIAPNSNSLHARLPSPAALMHLTASTLGRAKQCLANAIYFEARNEPVRGQIAVAQVVINRVFSGYYPNDLCDVVYQNASRHLDCQFTFACDSKRNVINERGAWARAQQIASQVLAGDIYDQAVGSSTHYHALYVRPDWVQEMKKLARYGTHNFYRPVAWGDGADAPVWGIVPLPPDKSKAQ
jgi:spore germination cell wall hydrolase CwlJ-like protein